MRDEEVFRYKQDRVLTMGGEGLKKCFETWR